MCRRSPTAHGDFPASYTASGLRWRDDGVRHPTAARGLAEGGADRCRCVERLRRARWLHCVGAADHAARRGDGAGPEIDAAPRNDEPQRLLPGRPPRRSDPVRPARRGVCTRAPRARADPQRHQRPADDAHPARPDVQQRLHQPDLSRLRAVRRRPDLPDDRRLHARDGAPFRRRHHRLPRADPLRAVSAGRRLRLRLRRRLRRSVHAPDRLRPVVRRGARRLLRDDVAARRRTAGLAVLARRLRRRGGGPEDPGRRSLRVQPRRLHGQPLHRRQPLRPLPGAALWRVAALADDRSAGPFDLLSALDQPPVLAGVRQEPGDAVRRVRRGGRAPPPGRGAAAGAADAREGRRHRPLRARRRRKRGADRPGSRYAPAHRSAGSRRAGAGRSQPHRRGTAAHAGGGQRRQRGAAQLHRRRAVRLLHHARRGGHLREEPAHARRRRAGS